MTSIEMRCNPLFLRNNFPSCGKWGFPLIKKQVLPSGDIDLIAYSDTRANDRTENTRKGVHFFIDDYRFEGIYVHPERSFPKLSQYAFLLTPEFSTYADMDIWRQLESTAHNRWIGAFWQSKGMTVIPSICWSTPRSYEFCFDGVEKHSTVAVGMIGSKREKTAFLRGYNAMLERLEPSNIIVFGTPFPSMEGSIIAVDYLSSRKVVR